ncbi:MAG: ScyD/ScyE family protein [Steroidobacteraceae bacterium]|nr:ScyD/ScyE family protein [Steroidobacteraceae bacterium]
MAVTGGALAQTVVMSGLDNPRGLAFSPNGALYVTEAGRGGPAPCVVNPGTGETRCYGKTGAISRLWMGQQSRVAEGFESHALPDGSSASGPNDISFQGTGGAFITLGLGGGPDFKEAIGAEHAGTLIHMAASGKWKVVADVLQHEVDENPAGGPVDSNPFGVMAEPGDRLIADAGANALLRVAANGTVETVVVFPPLQNPTGFGPPMIESVPTAVTRGADGDLYVAQLTGFPFVQGLANIYRVSPGQAPVVHCTGFKAIMDLAFASDGSLYVVENATGPFPPPPPFAPNSGRLTRVAPDCTVTPVMTGLNRPTAVAVGADGAVYVTNNGVTPGMGQVLMIEP